MALKRPLLGVALAASLVACSSPRTEIIVAVDSDLAVPGQLDNVTIDVTSPGGTTASSVAMLGASLPPLPRTLGLVYESGPVGPFLVRAVGERAGAAVVERRARVFFILERTLLLRLNLLDSCARATCAGDTTCAAGGCRGVDIASSELTDWNGTVPPLSPTDGGVMPRLDAGPSGRDAGPSGLDAGGAMPDAGCAGTEVCNGVDDNCDGRTDEGFDLMTDVANCGRCGNACSTQHGTSSCRSGGCGVGSCDTGWDDCDMSSANGCEANLSTSIGDCGMCGNRCTPSQTCCTGMCRPRGAC